MAGCDIRMAAESNPRPCAAGRYCGVAMGAERVSATCVPDQSLVSTASHKERIWRHARPCGAYLSKSFTGRIAEDTPDDLPAWLGTAAAAANRKRTGRYLDDVRTAV